MYIIIYCICVDLNKFQTWQGKQNKYIKKPTLQSEIHLQTSWGQESLKTVLEMRAKLYQQMLSLEDPWLRFFEVKLKWENKR